MEENTPPATPPATPPGTPPATPPATPPSPSGGDGQPPATYRPDGLPDHYFGKDNNETIDKLFKAVDGFRRTEGDRGTVPKTAAEYGFEASDKLKPYIGNFDKDPLYGAVRDIAHKIQMPDKMFKAFMPAVLEHFVEGGLVDQPIDAKAQLRALAGPNAAALDDAGKEAAGSKRVTANIAWVDGAKAQGALPDNVAEFFAASLASDPRAHDAIEWLRGKNGEPKPALPGGQGGGGGAEAVNARNLDPRNDPNSAKFDRAFAAETDRLMREQYGD